MHAANERAGGERGRNPGGEGKRGKREKKRTGMFFFGPVLGMGCPFTFVGTVKSGTGPKKGKGKKGKKDKVPALQLIVLVL